MRNGPVGVTPISSSNSRLAVSRTSSPGSISPLGIDQAPSSLFRKKGPPGRTSRTCKEPPPVRYISNPALVRDTAPTCSSSPSNRDPIRLFPRPCALPRPHDDLTLDRVGEEAPVMGAVVELPQLLVARCHLA